MPRKSNATLRAERQRQEWAARVHAERAARRARARRARRDEITPTRRDTYVAAAASRG